MYFTEANILTGLGEVLTDQQKIWTKSNLLKEMKEVLKTFE